MRIGILSGPYKEHLNAREVGETIKKGLSKSLKKANLEIFPIGDGGLGTSRILAQKYNTVEHGISVHGPNLKKIKASYFYNKKISLAIFDTAETCGIHLLEEKDKNPLKTTSLGVGTLYWKK